MCQGFCTKLCLLKHWRLSVHVKTFAPTSLGIKSGDCVKSDVNWVSLYRSDPQCRRVQLGWSYARIALVSSTIGSNFDIGYISCCCNFNFLS